MAESIKVLVLDGDLIPALSIARSLARKGLLVDIASHVDAPIAGFSRYVRRKLTYSDPLVEAAAFQTWCAEIMSDSSYRLIIPVTERTLVPMQQLLNKPGAEKLAMASSEALDVVLDKTRTLALATELGISVPRGVLIEDRNQLLNQSAGLNLPVVLKPARSIGANLGSRKQLSVEYAFTPAEAVSKATHLLNFGPVILQEYFRGQGVGIELIANRGEVVYAFQHLRLHEVPLTGGGSSLRVSVPVEPVLLEASTKLMRALRWHGVAMVEFKWNPDDQTYSLMEINGRFWGSLPLAVAAGADFPAMLYELMVEGVVRNRPPATIGVCSRKLSSDINWYEQVLRRDAPPGLVSFPGKREILVDIGRFFSSKHFFDVQSWRDPWPGLIDVSRIAENYFDRGLRYLRERRAMCIHQQAWHDKKTLERLRSARQVLFICYGNINRSALAERYYNMVAPSTAVQVVSAGFHEEEGRPADPVMIEVAAEAGIDMRNWASKRVDQKLVSDSDIILVMEQRHYDQIVALYPNAAERTLLLGMAPNGSTMGEIADPYGKPRPEYERCVGQVRASIDAVMRLARISSY